MTKKLEIYKCNICGNIVEILHMGAGQLICCGQPMVLLPIKTQEEGREKHVPVIEKTKKGIKVKVGSIAHPMEEKHYIEFIEVFTGDRIVRKFLKPNDMPEAEFQEFDTNARARELCTIHGLWSS